MTDFSAFFNRLSEPPSAAGRTFGVVIGVVTNNQLDDNGRIKVKFPWLSDQEESHWARIAIPERGFFFLPEVDDEVLVAFEHGRMEFPYIIGALWNGKDAPPDTNSDGKNNKRLIQSRSGQIIRLDDTDGKEKIEILNKDSKNTIVIDTADNAITITADKTVTIKVAGGAVNIECKELTIKAQADVKIEAGGSMDLKASGQMTIKGATVNIN
jgi:uncharacterized protein involved in type VI secretion and phage assembly